MIIFLSLLLGLVEVSSGSYLRSGHGFVLLLPALVLLASSLHTWRWFVALLMALALVTLFSPVALRFLLALLVLSGLVGTIFWRWIDQTNKWIHIGLVTLLLVILLVGGIPLASLSIKGVVVSLVMTLPVLIAGYSMMKAYD